MTAVCQIELMHYLGNKTKYLSELKKTFVRPLIQVAVKAIEQEHIEEGVLDRISQKYDISPEDVDEYFAAIYTIFKIYLKFMPESVRSIGFKEALEELKIPADCIEDLCMVLNSPKKTDLLSGVIQKTKFFPRLVMCKWQIDIIISSSVLNRVLEPNIIMEWVLDTGKSYVFELSLAQFHRLRHAVASILVEIQSLEEHSAFKNIHYS